jgi:hypothetical protein
MTDGLIPLQEKDKWGYKDQKGLEVIEPKFDYQSSFSQGLAAVKINDKWGFINQTGGEAVGVSPYPRLNRILATIVNVAVNRSQHDAMTNTGQ